MKIAKIDFDGRTLRMPGPKGTERLSIKSNYPWNLYTESIFAQFGTMHLVAPYLPRTISTNFGITSDMQKLIGAMYASVANERNQRGRKAPEFLLPPLSSDLNLYHPKLNNSDRKVVILYSSGKDSMWNLWWAMEEYGPENVLVVHIRGLNKNNGPNEFKHVLIQQKEFGFKHLEVIDLNNGSLNTGFRIMRSREMFIAGLTIPLALKFGATKIIREGYFDCTDPGAYFTGVEENMIYFNNVLAKLKIPVEVYWRNRDEMLTIKDLYEHRPEWMPHVCNCFTVLCYQPSHRRNFQKAMPTFPLYDSQCGVCVKCRITNVARILYDPSMNETNPEDIRKFLEKTDAWVRNQQRANTGQMSNVLDMIDGPFMRDFAKACRVYKINARCLA